MATPPPTIRLLGPTMFRAFRNVWMLEELQVPYEHVMAKPWGKTAKLHHPQGKIPVLMDGEFCLYESAAINTYLADKYESPLVPPPRNLQERAIYDQTTLCLMMDMDAQGLWIHRKHQELSEYFGACPEAVKEAKRQFDKVHEVMVAQLSEPGPYLLGKDFTAVDMLYVHCLNWAKSIGWFESPSENENTVLRKYLDLCKSRPAYQRTIAKRIAEEQAEKEKKPTSKM